MARRAEGWTLHIDERTGVYIVRFSHAQQRIKRSTGERDHAAAQREAARIYDEVTTATHALSPGRAAPALDVLLGHWLEAYSASHSRETVNGIIGMCKRTFIPFFRTLQRMTNATLADYMRARLRVVGASTTRKELSALRGFFAWCVERNYYSATTVPVVPHVPKRATGTRVGLQSTVPLSPEQVERIISMMPEINRSGYPVRDVVALIWETGLRDATIERISSPRHYRAGWPHLNITADIDKARFARELPLSARAREILDRHADGIESGLVFGVGCLRTTLKYACEAIGLPSEDARRVGPHDLRHAALTHLGSSEGATIAGIAYLAGHTTPAMTGKYIHPGSDAAARALAARTSISVPIPVTADPSNEKSTVGHDGLEPSTNGLRIE